MNFTFFYPQPGQQTLTLKDYVGIIKVSFVGVN